MERRRSLLPAALHAHARARRPTLGDGRSTPKRAAREARRARTPPHLPEEPALQARILEAGGQLARELHIPDEGHEPRGDEPRSRRVPPEVRGAPPRRGGLALDPDGFRALED